MSQDWQLYMDEDDMNQNLSSLLPSSLKEVWEVQPPTSVPQFPQFYQRVSTPEDFNNNIEISKPKNNIISPGSAPQSNYMSDFEFNFQSETDNNNILNQNIKNCKFFQVQFHPNRSEPFKCPLEPHYDIGIYVVTEADRGYDVGKIISEIENPFIKGIKIVKQILRLATLTEINSLPQKIEREKNAMEYCQSKALELKLPMKITGAEFQFDGKKLTFYYIAEDYVDFRILVRLLFKTFGMRIWMVWHDGISQIK